MPQLDNRGLARSLAEAAQQDLHGGTRQSGSPERDDIEVSTGNRRTSENAHHEVRFHGKAFRLSVHDISTCQDVLLNPAMCGDNSIEERSLLRLQELWSEGQLDERPSPMSDDGYVFLVRFASPEMRSKFPDMQISIPKPLFETLEFPRNTSVVLSSVSSTDAIASHVELVFRDQYLARADMWRLANHHLAGKCVYRNQKIEFMNAIKITVKTIFVKGRKVNSAFFHSSTKPIFRSESARYVLFIQMSKEMWEFDATGSGEIMYDKVVNGFLPELFRRWRQMQVRHLVTIVLFTRMEYPSISSRLFDDDQQRSPLDGKNDESQIKDFYQVVVSDMASIDSESILERLKHEFLVFLKDVSTCKPALGEYVPLGTGLSAATTTTPKEVVRGQPTTASRGNILEAINLASSQFSADYIDRDLIRTGVSIVLISPGTGLFEVNYSALIATTENLTDNGVGIDLVCLAKMPLHSVPLFRYKQIIEHHLEEKQALSTGTSNTPTRISSNTMDFGTPVSLSQGSTPAHGTQAASSGHWSFGIPHWIDISFWNTVEYNIKGGQGSTNPYKGRTTFKDHKNKPFIPRVRMYELQMMGITGDSASDISLPPMPRLFDAEVQPKAGDRARDTQLRKHLDTASKGFRAFHVRSDISWPGTSKTTLSQREQTELEQYHVKLASKWMDGYDAGVFSSSSRYNRAIDKEWRRTVNRTKQAQSSQERRVSNTRGANIDLRTPQGFSNNSELRETSKDISRPLHNEIDKVSTLGKSLQKPPKKISIGPRGLAIAGSTTAAAVATTDSFSSYGDARLREQQAIQSRALSIPQFEPEKSQRQGKSRTLESGTPPDAQESGISRPIPIRANALLEVSEDSQDTGLEASGQFFFCQDRVSTLKDLSQKHTEEYEDDNDIQYGPDLPTLSPSTTLAPWLTVLNPCNPSRYMMSSTHHLGRWQHLFPQPPKTSQIKWRSLCFPAAVPLTTEEFPHADSLAEEYRERSYIITLPESSDVSLRPRSIATELLAFRLARGFQIVVGEHIAATSSDDSLQCPNIFDEQLLTDTGSQVYLSRGSSIHRMKRTASDRLEVTTFLRHTVLRPLGLGDDAYLHYTPLIRSMLANTYEDQVVSTAPQRGNFNWEYIDGFIAGHERPHPAQYIEALRPWRARFVLIPMESATDSRRASRLKELTSEEVRLEGIKRLTQLWQKCQYILPEERRFVKNTRLSEGANPLNIQYYTKSASAIVYEELQNIIESGMRGQRELHLLPEGDLLQRSNVNTKLLAERLQSEKGVRIVDRRWHFKLHHYCFIGSEVTTWMLENFKDIHNREEAVVLGNELMKDGLFRHVERRHDFRDGHYFYQITDDYRSPRPEPKGFLGWTKASVPATPIKETPALGASGGNDWPQPNLEQADHLQSVASKRTEFSRPSVALGKSMIFNLVHSRPKTSYREELMNLHYDRLHNPENCYHIRVEWMNATPKLIQDVVNRWAMLVEAYGLRLVEVPIGEASSITSMHPFRAPYLIELALEPPSGETPSQYGFNSLLPREQVTDRHMYQKAILKHFNYVLDFEAASDFPPDVDVSYSWGKPDYRYPQYIHRSGLLIAQITDDGHFLLLANRLYNNKSSSNRTKSLEDDSHLDRSPMSHRTNPLRPGDGLTQRASPRASPISSPVLPATIDSHQMSTLANLSWLGQHSPKFPTAHHNVNAPVPAPDPESLTMAFQDFCSNAKALEAFYTEQVSNVSTSVSTTPSTSTKPTPLRKPDRAIEEHAIPNLTLPSSLTGRELITNRSRARQAGDARTPTPGL